MALELTLILKAVCEDCGNAVEERHYGDWFGVREEEGQLIEDMLMDLEFGKDWEALRIALNLPDARQARIVQPFIEAADTCE